MSVLEYLDNSTKNVIKLIVEKYLNDINKYKDNSKEQATGIGIELYEILSNTCNCELIKDRDSFVIRFKHEDLESSDKDLESSDKKEHTAYHGNNGFIIQTRVLQIINFLQKLSIEGLIMFAEPDLMDKYPQFKGIAFEETGTMIYPIHNKSLNSFIKQIYYSHIFPTETLISFKNKGFITVENERFKSSKSTSYIAIFVAVLIAVLSPQLMTQCSHTTIEQKQIDSIINVIKQVDKE